MPRYLVRWGAAAAVAFLAGCGTQTGTSTGEQQTAPEPYTSVVPAPTTTGAEGRVVASAEFLGSDQMDVTRGAECRGEGAPGSGENGEFFRCHDGHWVELVYQPPDVGDPCSTVAGGEYFYEDNKPTYRCEDGHWRTFTGSPSPVQPSPEPSGDG